MLKYFIILFLIVSCSSIKKKITPNGVHDSVHTDHLNTASMRLAPRASYPGMLVNRVCLGFSKDGNCIAGHSVKVFDTSKKETREMLINFRFACYVGGKRYRICKEKNGLCRQEYGCLEYKKKLITRKTYCAKYGTVKTHYLDMVKDFDYIVQGGTGCKANY